MMILLNFAPAWLALFVVIVLVIQHERDRKAGRL